MSDVCSNCPHAVLDHDATGCITCKCGAVYEAADPETTPSPEDAGTTEPETTEETSTVVPETEGDSAAAE